MADHRNSLVRCRWSGFDGQFGTWDLHTLGLGVESGNPVVNRVLDNWAEHSEVKF
jgi:hypothetical protein